MKNGTARVVAGEQIPLAARLMAVADVFDALTTSRPYKTAMTREQVVALIVQDSGKHFDPQVVEAFMTIQDEFQSIADKWIDA